MIRKTLITSALACALALAPLSPRPAAAAEGEDIARLLLGLVVVGAVVNALDNGRGEAPSRATNRYDDEDWYRSDDDDDRRWIPPGQAWDPPGHAWGRRDDHRGNRHWGRRELPSYCMVELRNRRDRAQVFGERCLERAGVRVNRLPQACAFDIRTDRGRRTIYGARCLQEFGYRVADARRR